MVTQVSAGMRARSPQSRDGVTSPLRRLLPPLFRLIIALAVVGLGFWLLAIYFEFVTPQDFWFGALAGLFGALVAASELVSRYRDEPLLAIMSLPASTYLALNFIISASVYALLSFYEASLMPVLGGDKLLTAVVAGFGAMAILRSKFFTFRTERGEDVAVGPDAVVAAFLSAADRGVDRSRAADRLNLVFEWASRIQDPKSSGEFMQVALGAFQNLSTDEKRELVSFFESTAKLPYPDDLKLQAMSYYILGITGERNFSRVMRNLEDYARGSQDAERGKGPPSAPSASVTGKAPTQPVTGKASTEP